MINVEIIVRVFIQVQHTSVMTLLQHTKLLIFLELWVIILEALRKCIVKKLKLLQLFLGPTLYCLDYVLSFGQMTSDGQTDGRQTESDAYEPTTHKHRCAQKLTAAFIHPGR